jgi:hypothetical protein
MKKIRSQIMFEKFRPVVMNDSQVIKPLVKATAIGAAVGLSLASGVTWFDISSIGTMITASAGSTLIFSLFIGGSIAKGALFGFTFATMGLRLKGQPAHQVTAPLLVAIPSRA